MDMMIPAEINELLHQMNEVAPTVLYGGFLRDVYASIEPNDVDIATHISPSHILRLFPHAQTRLSYTGHQIIALKWESTRKWFLEIYPTDTPLSQKSDTADYTINSLLYDGLSITDPHRGMEDLQEGIIREVSKDTLEKDFIAKPQLWFKTIRLQAKTGFIFSPVVKELLIKHKHHMDQISILTRQTEGYKTLRGKHALGALQELSNLEVIPSFDFPAEFKTLDLAAYGIHFSLCELAIVTSLRCIQEAAKFYAIPDEVVLKAEELYHAYFQSDKIVNVKIKNQIIELRKRLH